jgi:hypothetical protein
MSGKSCHSGLVLVAATAISAAVFIFVSSADFPDVGATHFDTRGQANATMSRGVYRGYMAFLVLVVPLLVAGLPAVVARRWPMLLNIPSRDYWLAPERGADTLASLRARTALLAIVMIALITFVHVLVLRANAGDEPELDQQLLLVGLATFVAFIIGWIVSLYRRFRRPGT